MISKKAKEELVEEIARELQQAELIILADYRGLNVASVTQLRRRLKAEQCRYRVVKNTLTRLACRKIGLDKLEPYLEGPTAIAYTAADPVGAAKVMLEFTRENEAFSIKGGSCRGSCLARSRSRRWAKFRPARFCWPGFAEASRHPWQGWSMSCRAISASWFMPSTRCAA